MTACKSGFEMRRPDLLTKFATVHRFRVKDKESIEGPKSSLKMLIFPNNCALCG